MAQGGGRGWFRRRTHADEAALPETSPVDAAQPARDVPAPPAETSQSAPSSDVSTAIASNEAAAMSPTQPTAEGAARPVASQPSEGATGNAAGQAGDVGPAPTRPRSFDWDAATAAALSDDDSSSAAAPAPVRSAGTPPPDQFLEDLIREIVGDAAVDTVESLHQSAPAACDHDAQQQPALGTDDATPAEPAPRTGEPEISQTRILAGAGESDASSSVQSPVLEERDASAPEPSGPQSEPALPVDDAPGADNVGVSSREHHTIAAPASAPDPPPVTMDRAGDATIPPTRSDPSNEAAAIPAPPTAPAIPPQTIPDPDVSRETSITLGGTPLADALADETRRRIALDEAVLPLPPKTRVLTISNQKGGVGKTTTAVNLAAALARSGARVLVIDLDPQGNASTALGVDHRSEQQSVYEVLVSDLALAEVIRPSTEHERLDCVPATIHLAGAEIELVSLVAREQRLRRALDTHLASMERPYDYVFIDCPPSLGLLTINAFVAAREVLIPIQCEYYALEGLSQLLSNIELIEKHLNPELRLSTILLTMYDSRTNLAQQVAQEVRDHFPTQTLQTIIPRSVRVSEAPSYGQSVISYDFTSSGSLSYREAAAEIARRGAAVPDATSTDATSTKEHH
jgi:cellulose biosynthesis protein BcsQ